MQQIVVRNEAGELDAIRDARFLAASRTCGPNHVSFPTSTRSCRKCGISPGQFRECRDQANVILARLEIPYAQHERPGKRNRDVTCWAACWRFNNTEAGVRRIGHDGNILLRDAIGVRRSRCAKIRSP